MSMPHFDLFFKTEALRQRIEPLLDRIPLFFDFTVRVGTPALAPQDPADRTWSGFKIPADPYTAYVFDDEVPAAAAGGCSGTRVGVRVWPENSDTVLALRLWHELLHAVGQPADDMIALAETWQTPWQRILWTVWRWCGDPVDVPFWHRRYYAWLTERAARSD